MKRLLVPLLACAAVAGAAEPAQPTPLTAVAGQPFAFTPRFGGSGLEISAVGLPEGMRIDPATGRVSGRPLRPGIYPVAITARNEAGAAVSRIVLTVTAGRTAAAPTTQLPAAAPAAAVAAAKPAPPARPTAAPPPPLAPVKRLPPPPPPPAHSDDEEDEADPMLASGALSPWTDNQRRVIQHWFLPGAASLDAGQWYYRISHVARKGYEEEARTNLLGLDDDVKIGFMVGYAPAKGTTLTLQRVNGRDLAVPPIDNQAVQFDTWELLAKGQILDQRGVRGWRQGPCDLSLVAGASWMLRNHGTGDVSLDLGVVAERDLLADRLRLGVGVWHAGLSAYDGAVGGTGPGSKRFPDETGAAAENATSALGFTVRYALAEHWFLLGEAVSPLSGWDTGHGPALALGAAFDTNTHEFAVYFTNTANAAFNSVLTGGAQELALPFFAFSISAHL